MTAWILCSGFSILYLTITLDLTLRTYLYCLWALPTPQYQNRMMLHIFMFGFTLTLPLVHTKFLWKYYQPTRRFILIKKKKKGDSSLFSFSCLKYIVIYVHTSHTHTINLVIYSPLK